MKTFSVEEANRTLPLVRRIVQDIVSQYARWQDSVRDFEGVAASGEVPNERAESLQREVQVKAAEIDACIAELRELGIEFKDFKLGLIDFPGELDGRSIYLCWRLGEPAVEHWHELADGFAGRRPLTPSAVA